MDESSYISLTEAARLLPRRRAGRPAHVSTLHRWARRGLRGIRLETTLVGGVRCTTRDALQRFIQALNDGSGERIAPPHTPDVVRRQLDDLGI